MINEQDRVKPLAVGVVLVVLSLAVLPNAISVAQSSGASNVQNAGTVTIGSQTYPVQLITTAQPTSEQPSSVVYPTLFPGMTSQGGSDPYWQYGGQWESSSTYYGGAMTVTFFNGQSNPDSFAFWFGLTDNDGNFYQDGLSYWASPGSGCYAYTGWAVDDYNGGSLGVSNCPTLPAGQFSTNPVDSPSQAVDVAAWVYKGQWYYSFTGSVSKSGAFPNGADGGTSVSGRVGEILEGWSSTGYTSGEGVATNLEYVYEVALVSGVLTIYFAYTNNMVFYVTSNSGSYITPPTGANWGIDEGSLCPYYYASYFTSSAGSLPAYGSSQATCVP